MTKNILYEGKILQDIHQEYLTLVNFYHNVKRPSLIVKYFNINIPASFREEDLESTYDYYSASYISFDIYENTPAQNIQTVNNRSSNIEDLIGVHLEGSSNIVVYTIQRPRINDLVVFYYPIQSEEIFRVKDLSVSSNAIHSDPSVTWYELDLEYAPIESTLNLKINKRYVYDFSKQLYLEYDSYVEKLKVFDKIDGWFQLLDNYYSERYDLYKIGNYVPLFVNEFMAILKKKYNYNYNRLFESHKLPYGYYDYFSDYYFAVKKENNVVNNIVFDSYTFIKEEDWYKILNLEDETVYDFEWDNETYESNSLEELLYIGKELSKITNSIEFEEFNYPLVDEDSEELLESDKKALITINIMSKDQSIATDVHNIDFGENFVLSQEGDEINVDLNYVDGGVFLNRFRVGQLMEFQEVKEYFENYVQEYSPYKDNAVYSAIVDYLIDYYLKNLYEEIPKQHKYLYEDNEIKNSVKDNLLISLGVYKNVVSQMSYFEKNIFIESLRGFYQFKGSVKFFQQVAKSFRDDFNIYELYADYDEINQKWVLKPFPIYINKDILLNEESLDYDEVYNEVPSLLVHSNTLSYRNTNREIILPYKTNIILLDYLFINEIYGLYQLIFSTYLNEYGQSSVSVYFQDDSFAVTMDFIVGLWYYLFSYTYDTNWSEIDLIYCVFYDKLKNNYTLEDIDSLVKTLEELKTTNEISNFYQEYIAKIFESYYENERVTVSEFKNSLRIKNSNVMDYVENRLGSLSGQDLKDEVIQITNEIYDSLILSQFEDLSSDEFKQTYLNIFLQFLPQVVKQPKETVSHLLLYNFKPYHVELIDRSSEIISSKNKLDMVLPEDQYSFLFKLLRADYLSISTDLFVIKIYLEKYLSQSPVDLNDYYFQKIIEEDGKVNEEILQNFFKYSFNVNNLNDQFKDSFIKPSYIINNISDDELYRFIFSYYNLYSLLDEESNKVNLKKIFSDIFNNTDYSIINQEFINQDHLVKLDRLLSKLNTIYNSYLNQTDLSLVNSKILNYNNQNLDDYVSQYDFSLIKNELINLNFDKEFKFVFNFEESELDTSTESEFINYFYNNLVLNLTELKSFQEKKNMIIDYQLIMGDDFDIIES